MANKLSLYTAPNAMEPLFPNSDLARLEELAAELLQKSARLSGTLNPITRKAVADFLRPMNCYYSNLIEGHDTHPIDIAKALNNDFSNDKMKRDLQKEAKAHIVLHKEITKEIESNKLLPSETRILPTSKNYIKSIHKRFYDNLPEDFKEVKSKEGEIKHVIPGEFRIDEIEVGRHIGPFSGKLDDFMDRFEDFYTENSIDNKSKIRRIISIAASHHRLAWIHPFLDGNGRVVRLFSDACFIYENVDSSGLWSISRGLARNNSDYKAKLANADLKRFNNYDGRGNLSDKMLYEFCEFFLLTAIDQIDYMFDILDVKNMVERISAFVDLLVVKNKIKAEAKYILIDVFLKGKISKSEAMWITKNSDKTLKLLSEKLEEMGLIKSVKEGIHIYYYVKFPVHFSPMFFPGIYPSDKEAEMILNS